MERVIGADSECGAVSSEAGLTASASDVDYALIEGGGVVYEMYGPQGPCASNLIGNMIDVDHTTGTVGARLSIIQVPVNPPDCWRPECDMIGLFLSLHGDVEVTGTTETGTGKGPDEIYLGAVGDDHVELRLSRQGHSIRVRARTCLLDHYKAYGYNPY